MENAFYNETLQMIEENRLKTGSLVANECIRLLNSGAIDKNYHSRSDLFKAAFQSIADSYWISNAKDYHNLRKF